MDADVIVVGAGPTGLMAAAELGLAGLSVLVLERAAERSHQSKAGGIQPRTAEVFELRGLLADMLPAATPRADVGGHFAGLPVPLDCTPFGTRFVNPVSIPQYEVEQSLERHLDRYPGVALRRECEVTALTADADGVTVALAGGERLRCAYLVGCDGGHSTVRRLTGVAFPGRSGRFGMVASDIRVDGIDVGQRVGHMSQHVHRGDGGGAILAPLGGGLCRFMFGVAEQATPREAPVTEAEVQRALTAVFGAEVRLTELRYATRFSDASRQVARYRMGRVLLAGDAAHIHLPAGGQGINLGVQDAMNLGWKLAATVRGTAPAGLLDSYHEERHPVAARVLTNTRAQGVLMSPVADDDVAALREVFSDLMRVPEANRYLSGMISGLDTTYATPGTPHPLLGARMPDVPLYGGWLSGLLGTGRGLLLGAGDVSGWTDRVNRIDADLSEFDADALLIRPDGHVCATRAVEVEAALRRWFGEPSAQVALDRGEQLQEAHRAQQ